MSDNQPHQFSGEQFNDQVFVNGNLHIKPTIQIAQTPWLLDNYHFDKLVNSESKWLQLGNAASGASIGLFINLIAKAIGSKMDKSIIFDKWEVYAFCLSISLMGACYLTHKVIPNERRRIVKTIKAHFKKTRHGQI